MALEEDLQNVMCHNMFAAVIINFLHSKDAIINRYHFGDVYYIIIACKFIMLHIVNISSWND